jgi:hypothetical protein
VKATSSAGQVAEIEYNEIKVAGVGSFGVVKQALPFMFSVDLFISNFQIFVLWK